MHHAVCKSWMPGGQKNSGSSFVAGCCHGNVLTRAHDRTERNAKANCRCRRDGAPRKGSAHQKTRPKLAASPSDGGIMLGRSLTSHICIFTRASSSLVGSVYGFDFGCDRE